VVADAGSVAATSTKAKVLTATLPARRELGRASVLNLTVAASSEPGLARLVPRMRHTCGGFTQPCAKRRG
jgi:hypothetical protein